MKLLNIINSTGTFLFINVVLIYTLLSTFNPNNLNLLELKYFGGFDMFNLFPTNLYSIGVLILSVLGLIFINIFFCIKMLRK